MSKKYKVEVPTTHRKIRDETRTNRANKRGSKTKYKIAFVTRKRKTKGKKNGRIFQLFVDPTTRNDGEKKIITTTEAYELTREQVNVINEKKESTCLDILTSPVGKVDFRWISRDVLRTIRRDVRERGTVLTKD